MLRPEVFVDAEFARARRLVELTVGALGVDPKTAVAQEAEGSVTWTLQRGSAAVLITLAARETGPAGAKTIYLRVVSPVVTLADGAPAEPLLRHLLELNAAGLGNAAFGLTGKRVVVVSERPVADLQSAEVDQMVRHLGAVADTYDDRLAKQFGVKRGSDR